MGRELRRVPLDFDWPLGKVWGGYINPYYQKCPDCENGYSPAGEWLNAIMRLFMLAGNEREIHPWLKQIPFAPSKSPGEEFTQLTSALSGRAPSVFGHDSSDQWLAAKKIIETAGLDPNEWGVCPTCKGDAMNPAVKDLYEAWEESEPPEGEGYQLWETTSEGSPITPVFETLREVAEYAAEHCTVFAGAKTSADEWEAMLAKDDVELKVGNFVFL